MLYRAFISYSHAADGKLAPAVQSALQQFAKPWYRLRAIRVFRDETNLSANPDLWGSIEKALSESAYFILMSSPEAAASKWVKKEIDYWLKNKSADKILIIQTSGAIEWDDATGDFDWNKTTAVPENLKKAFAQVPKYVDLSWARKQEHLSRRQSAFQGAIALLAATLHDKPLDEIAGEDVRQHRRTVRIAWFAGIALGILTISSMTAAYLAIQQRNFAERQRQIAVSRHLAANAELLKSEQLDLSLLLSVEAVSLVRTPEARRSLLAGVQATADLARFVYHTGIVNGVKFSPDGTALAAAGDSGVTLWDHSSGRLLTHLDHRGSSILSITFSSEGKTLVAGSRDGSIVMWNLADGQRLGALLTAGAAVTSLALSNDGMTLASGLATGNVLIWNTLSRVKVGGPFRASGLPIFSVTFDPLDQKRLMVGGMGSVLSWNVATKQLYGDGKAIPAGSMAVSPNGRFIALSEFGETNRRVIVFDRIANDQFTGDPPEQIVRLDVANNGKVVSSSLEGNIIAWLPYQGRLVPRPLVRGGKPVTSVAISSDGRTLACSSQGFGVALWKVPGAPRLRQQLAGAPPTSDLAFSSESAIVVAGTNGTIATWNTLPSKPTVASVAPGFANQVQACSPDGRVLVSVSKDQAVYLWDVAQMKPIGGPLARPGGQVVTIVISSDKKTVAAGTKEGKLLAWNDLSIETNGRLLAEFSDSVEALALSADGRVVAVTHLNDISYSIHLWDVSTGDRIAEMQPGHTFPVGALAFNPKGRILATGSWDKTVRLLDVMTRKVLGPPLTGHKGPVLDIKFSPDGNTLASADQQGVIIWDVPTSTLLGRLSVDDSDGIRRVAFSPEGRYLAVGGPRAAYVWDLSVDEWKSVACYIANRDLTDQEWRTYLGNGKPQETCKNLRLAGPSVSKR